MKRISKNKSDQKWLKDLGLHIEGLIVTKGYGSVYDFWLRCAKKYISKSSLSYIVSGSGDPKASTLRQIAKLLNLKTRDLFSFEERT